MASADRRARRIPAAPAVRAAPAAPGGGVANERRERSTISGISDPRQPAAPGAAAAPAAGSTNAGSGTGGIGGAGGAGSSGGGIWSAAGSLEVTNSTIASNTTGDGGAGGNGGLGVGGGSTGGHGANGGDSGSGGAVAASGSSSPPLLNVTVVGNKVGQPGRRSRRHRRDRGCGGQSRQRRLRWRLAGLATAVLDASRTACSRSTGAATAARRRSPTEGTTSPPAMRTCPISFATGDPNLGPLQDNGGPSWTVSLQAGSAAIDQIPATGADCPATDQRGVARPAGAKCDIGAYELAAAKVSTAGATAVGRTSATLHGSVTPNSGLASVQFVYGTTTKYGSKTSDSSSRASRRRRSRRRSGAEAGHDLPLPARRDHVGRHGRGRGPNGDDPDHAEAEPADAHAEGVQGRAWHEDRLRRLRRPRRRVSSCSVSSGIAGLPRVARFAHRDKAGTATASGSAVAA